MSDDKVLQQLADEIALLKREVARLKLAEAPATSDLGLSLITVAATGANPSVTIPVTPQNYRHLLLMGQTRSSAAAENDGLLMQFNGDTGNNYDWQRLTANSTTLSGAVGRGVSSVQIGAIEGANSRADSFSPVQAYIYLYSQGVTYEKYCMAYNTFFGDVSADTDMFVQLRGGRWRNTDAITSITLLTSSTSNFVAGSGFELYGIR